MSSGEEEQPRVTRERHRGEHNEIGFRIVDEDAQHDEAPGEQSSAAGPPPREATPEED